MTKSDIPELFLQTMRQSHAELNIDSDYASSCGLPIYPEPTELVDTEADIFHRPQKLTPAAFLAWSEMKAAAAAAGVTIYLISAFRSLQYQHNLIAAKLAKGQEIGQILQVNAAPGHSEHHTGMAVDLGTPDCENLAVEFENTKTFQWLVDYAPGFGFTLSYPADNTFGIDFEPWHWCFNPD